MRRRLDPHRIIRDGHGRHEHSVYVDRCQKGQEFCGHFADRRMGKGFCEKAAFGAAREEFLGDCGEAGVREGADEILRHHGFAEKFGGERC